jgi:hypothetical protein
MLWISMINRLNLNFIRNFTGLVKSGSLVSVFLHSRQYTSLITFLSALLQLSTPCPLRSIHSRRSGFAYQAGYPPCT